MRLENREGAPIPVMGNPMGPIDISAGDFEAFNPKSPRQAISFGIDPEASVELTVVNLFDQEVTQTFQAGPNPYLIKKVKEDATVTTVINYFI